MATETSTASQESSRAVDSWQRLLTAGKFWMRHRVSESCSRARMASKDKMNKAFVRHGCNLQGRRTRARQLGRALVEQMSSTTATTLPMLGICLWLRISKSR